MPTGSARPPARPKWPSLEEQLRLAAVIHGSALEQLIKDNQDFSLLRPEEANDALDLAPWLRVHWRKLHPDADYSGPSGGYPLVLLDLGEWMLRHQDFVPDPADVEVPDDRPKAAAAKPMQGGRRGN